jgi:hypothetical protein
VHEECGDFGGKGLVNIADDEIVSAFEPALGTAVSTTFLVMHLKRGRYARAFF